MSSKVIRTKSYVVWVGGIDDHYDSFRAAVNAYDNWRDKGYDDVILEEYATTTTISLIARHKKAVGA